MPGFNLKIKLLQNQQNSTRPTALSADSQAGESGGSDGFCQDEAASMTRAKSETGANLNTSTKSG